jgi:hypothetical protein
MLKRLLALVAGLFIVCVTTAWAAIKFMLELWGHIDAATALDAKGGYLEKGVNWLFSTPNWMPGAAVAAVIIIWALLAWNLLSRRDDPPAVSHANQRAVELKPNTEAAALDISSGVGDKYDNLQIFENGIARRTALLKLQNCGNGLLSDCRVFVRTTSPVIADRSIVLKPSIPLVPGQYVFFPVATFLENPGNLAAGTSLVTICEQYGGGWAPEPITVEAPSREKPLLLSIEAIATECAPIQARYRLWVDQPSRRLRMEPA